MRHGTVRRGLIPFLFAAASLLQLDGAARAADREQRDFAIFIDGKESGQSRLTLTRQDDGSMHMSASVNVTFKKVFFGFNLTIDAQEWWKDGKLVGLRTTSTENGKKTEVTGTMEAGTLRVRNGGLNRAVNPEAWTTSYWQLPDARYHNKQVPLLDVDTGKEYTGQLQYVGTQQLKVGNDLQNCYHFRVVGGPTNIDLWFDPHHRLVRQEFVDTGYRTIVQLTGIRR